jgi:hypothetical protein
VSYNVLIDRAECRAWNAHPELFYREVPDLRQFAAEVSACSVFYLLRRHAGMNPRTPLAVTLNPSKHFLAPEVYCDQQTLVWPTGLVPRYGEVLHDLAHLCAPKPEGDKGEHGYSWVAAYVSLTHYFLGGAPAATLMRCLNERERSQQKP